MGRRERRREKNGERGREKKREEGREGRKEEKTGVLMEGESSGEQRPCT